MKTLSYWNCKYGNAEEEEIELNGATQHEWRYYCDHPQNRNGVCIVDNQNDENVCLLVKEDG